MITPLLKRFRILKTLGQGGCGEVLCVLDTHSREKRALKLLHHDQSHLTLKNEFKLLSSLSHPHLAKVYDYGVCEFKGQNTPYLVSEYIEGENLFEWSKRASSKELLAVTLDLCETLQFLHNHQVLHADLKPQNILMDLSNPKKPFVKLIDFGLSLLVTESSRTKGFTTEYSAPELIATGKASFATDIYALGVVLYKLFTRTLPALTDPTPPSVLCKNLNSAYNPIFLRMISKDPSDRYTLIEEILNDLSWVEHKAFKKNSHSASYRLEPFFLREPHQKKLVSFLKNRFYASPKKRACIFIVEGKAGTGKTQFLNDTLLYAKENQILNLNYKDFQTHPNPLSIHSPTLVVAKDFTPDTETLNYLYYFFKDRPLAFVFSSSEAIKPNRHLQKITLKPFDFKQTQKWINTITAFTDWSLAFYKKAYQKTKGMPDALKQLLDHLNQKNLLPQNKNKPFQKILRHLNEFCFFDFELKTKTLKSSSTKNVKAVIQNESRINPKKQFYLNQWKKARLYFLKHDFKKTLLILNQILKSSNPTHLNLIIQALELKGQAQIRMGQWINAEKTLLMAHKLLLKHPKAPHSLWVNVLGRLSWVKGQRGDRLLSLELAKKADLIFNTKLTLKEKRSSMALNLDEIYYQSQEWEKALICLQENFELLKHTKFNEAYAITLYKMARVFLKMNKGTKAKKLLFDALTAFKKLSAHGWLAYVYNELALLEKQNLNLELAKDYLTQGMSLMRLFKKEEGLFLMAQNLGNLNLQLNNEAEAKKCFLYAFHQLKRLTLTDTVCLGLVQSALSLATLAENEPDLNLQEWVAAAKTYLKKRPHLAPQIRAHPFLEIT